MNTEDKIRVLEDKIGKLQEDLNGVAVGLRDKELWLARCISEVGDRVSSLQDAMTKHANAGSGLRDRVFMMLLEDHIKGAVTLGSIADGVPNIQAATTKIVEAMAATTHKGVDLNLIRNTYESNGIIPAIKEYRKVTGMSLKEGRDAIEALAAEHGWKREPPYPLQA